MAERGIPAMPAEPAQVAPAQVALAQDGPARDGTTAEVPAAAQAADEPRVIRTTSAAGTATFAGAATGALGLVWVLYERVLPFSGVLGFWLCWYALFLVFYTVME